MPAVGAGVCVSGGALVCVRASAANYFVYFLFRLWRCAYAWYTLVKTYTHNPGRKSLFFCNLF